LGEEENVRQNHCKLEIVVELIITWLSKSRGFPTSPASVAGAKTNSIKRWKRIFN